MDTAVFLNQKGANVCEHTTKVALLENFWTKIEKDGRVRQNILIKFACACPMAISSFFGKSFPFPFPYFEFLLVKVVNSQRETSENDSCIENCLKSTF